MAIEDDDDDGFVINNIVEKKFLHSHLNEKVTVFLANGVKLDCDIIEFDDVSIVATQRDKKKVQLIYKRNISSITET